MSASQAGRRRFESGRPLSLHARVKSTLACRVHRVPPSPGTTHTVIAITVTGYADEPARAQASVRKYGTAARARRSATVLLKWLLVAAGGLLIPVAHFLLVPAAIILGMVQCVTRIRTKAEITACSGTCPSCHTAQDFEILGRLELPRTVSCIECGRGLILHQG